MKTKLLGALLIAGFTLASSHAESAKKAALITKAEVNAAQQAWCDALVAIGLAARLDVPARSLSQGQRRRVALARLLTDRRSALWILDEPFTALDVRAVALLADAMAAHLARGGAIIYTTHQPVAIAAARSHTLNLDDYAC